MLNSVLAVNDAQPNQVVDILEQKYESLAGRRCLILGLAFKPGTDDVRESASLRIVEALVQRGAIVLVHDPKAIKNFKSALDASMLERVSVVDNWREALADSEVVILATKWADYRDLAQLNISDKTIFDARRMFAVDELAAGDYLTIGRRLFVE